ncbi:MAG: hypothetical protein AB1646_25800 [Thermodesulfobacteriota bacterium]
MAAAAVLSSGPACAQDTHARPFLLGIPLYFADSRMEADDIAFLRRFLTDRDILFFRGAPSRNLYARHVRIANTAVIRQSLSDLRRDANAMLQAAIPLDYLCYNPEVWPTSHTPPEEKADLVAATRRARALSRQLNVKLIVVPDTKHTLPLHGKALAALADAFGIQLQAFQLDYPEPFREKTRQLVRIVRSGNPSVPIIAQLSTNPPTGLWDGKTGKVLRPMSPEEIKRRVDAIRDLVDGFGFLLFKGDDGVSRFRNFIELERSERTPRPG